MKKKLLNLRRVIYITCSHEEDTGKTDCPNGIRSFEPLITILDAVGLPAFHVDVLLVHHAILPNERMEGMRDDALRTSAWEAIVLQVTHGTKAIITMFM